MKRADCQGFYSRPDWYDEIAREYVNDIPYYMGLAKRLKGPVLELSCGTGRVGIPMIEAGLDYWGIDISSTMMKRFKEKAREKGLNPNLVKGDVRKFSIKKKFNLIFYPYSAMAHIHEIKDLEALLRNVRKHLTKEGRLAFDIFNPSVEILSRKPDFHFPVHEFADPISGKKIVVTETHTYDKSSQINHAKWHYRIGRKKDAIVNELNIRIYYPQELDALLKYNGFRIEKKYGRYDKSKFASESPRMFYVCRVA